jgi:hypothetical protein
LFLYLHIKSFFFSQLNCFFIFTFLFFSFSYHFFFNFHFNLRFPLFPYFFFLIPRSRIIFLLVLLFRFRISYIFRIFFLVLLSSRSRIIFFLVLLSSRSRIIFFSRSFIFSFSYYFFSHSFIFSFFFSFFMTTRQRPVEWSDDATLYLIRLRRHYHDYFNVASHNVQRPIWTTIANHIQTTCNLTVTEEQCRTKWYSLKYGYENLRRLHDANPYHQPITNPTLHDRFFFQELSDEFWLRTGN